ncbi:hypothetical protein [Streptomyces salinarius]|uniref:hypothetical protein n=1 Tax=Streptomyces salinarius TaxID=2762598 RepID=UPI002852CC1D|nr:hypothetical protein [Streptomyces salinarius]
MAAAALYGVTARRGEELVRCEDVTSLPELAALVAAYAADFGDDPAVRVDVDTVPTN